MKFGKWIGGGLGWVLGGPIGALLGFAIGTFVDSATVTRQISTTTKGDFTVSLMVLIAAVMKADGKVLKSELDYVKNYLTRSFGSEVTRDLLLLLRKLLEQEIPVQDVSHQIKIHMDYASRLQLLHFLYGISKADREVHPLEIQTIEIIANNIGITKQDQVSIRSMFIEETDSSYKILEINKNATNEEIKKAYRKMAQKYHPDKVSHLGDEVQRQAKVKFQKVNEAYEKIKKERGMV